MCTATASGGSVRIAPIFCENMVLQRDVPVPVWGWAPDGEEITVRFDDKELKTVATGGKWSITLPPHKAGGPFTLAVQSKNVADMIMFTQVMVGEVWIVAGQSNAIMTVEQADGYKEAVAERLKYPNIRIASIINRMPHQIQGPQQDIVGWWGPIRWENSTYIIPRSSGKDIPGGSSAISYYFARELYKYMKGDVPVGMIELGAILPVQSWIDDDTVAATPEIASLRGKPYPSATSCSYNAYIAPLAPFPVRGAIYYQGEMNAGQISIYRAALPVMISCWRKAWSNPDMPFLIVQLPSFIKHLGPTDKRLDMDKSFLSKFDKEKSTDNGYPGIREAQLLTWQKTPNTGMAITMDLGDAYDIHPKRKRQVSERLFLQARQLIYGDKDMVASGPVPDKFEIRGNEFVVHFKYTGTGLRKSKLEGFELSDDGKKFVAASARIDGDTVIISSPDVPNPKAVRYDWAGFPPVTLYNKEGLPATPFRYPVE